jgi:pyruvate-formate lyase-activating enzyme
LSIEIPNNLPPPYRVNTVGLLLTLRCNATCEHCCFECHPNRNKQMTQHQVIDYIHQIGGVEDVHLIAVTGGEPFSAYPLLLKAIEEAGRQGLNSRIVTNGYWATSAKRAHERLAPLVDRGLVSFNISYDSLHAPYVEQDRVKQAVETALDFGLEVVISHSSLRGPREGDKKMIFESLGFTEDDPISLIQGIITPSGRARKTYSLNQVSLVDGEKKEGHRLHDVCTYVLREPVITPDGDLFACCGTTVATRTGFRKEFLIGNLDERPLTELLQDLEYDPLFNALMLEGPWQLYQILKPIEPGLIKRQRFVNICDLCEQIVCNQKAIEKLIPILAQQELPLMIKKMMLNAAREDKLEAHN